MTGHDEVQEVRVVEQVPHEGALARPAEPGHPVLDVGDEALARLLPVVADVDPGVDLRGDDRGGGGRALPAAAHRSSTSSPRLLLPVELGEGAGPGQAPGVGGEDPSLAAEQRSTPRF